MASCVLVYNIVRPSSLCIRPHAALDMVEFETPGSVGWITVIVFSHICLGLL